MCCKTIKASNITQVCDNEGVCVLDEESESGPGYHCQCQESYTGQHCQVSYELKIFGIELDRMYSRFTACVRVTRAGTRQSARCSVESRSLCVTALWDIREPRVRTG